MYEFSFASRVYSCIKSVHMSRFPQLAEQLSQWLQHEERSASWVANRLEINPSTVNRWVNGETRPNSPEEVLRLCDVLGLHKGEQHNAMLAAAGYAPANSKAIALPTPPPSATLLDSIVNSVVDQAIERSPAPIGRWLSDQLSIYEKQAIGVPPLTTSTVVIAQAIDLDQQRLLLSSSLGAYFTGLLERDNLYIDLAQQIDAPVGLSQTQVSPLQQLLWALQHPRGPQALIIAADGGMGKSTLAAQLVRALVHGHGVDLILGDSAKTRQANVVTSTIRDIYSDLA